MNRNEVLTELKKYFSIEELVCKHTFKKFGEKSWLFFPTNFLHTLLIIRRDILKVGMVVNDWKFGGRNTQRGLRCNICQLVKSKTLSNQVYLSSHRSGMAFDAVFGAHTGMTAHKARELIKANANRLPCNIRIEKGVTWLHVDVYDTGKKIHEFNP